MERDFGKEIDVLREEIRAMKEERPQPPKTSAGFSSIMSFLEMSPEDVHDIDKGIVKQGDKPTPKWGMELAQIAIDNQYKKGFMRVSGIHRTAETKDGNMWSLEYPLDEILNLDESTVEKILTAIGNRARIKILKAIFKFTLLCNFWLMPTLPTKFGIPPRWNSGFVYVSPLVFSIDSWVLLCTA